MYVPTCHICSHRIHLITVIHYFTHSFRHSIHYQHVYLRLQFFVPNPDYEAVTVSDELSDWEQTQTDTHAALCPESDERTRVHESATRQQ